MFTAGIAGSQDVPVVGTAADVVAVTDQERIEVEIAWELEQLDGTADVAAAETVRPSFQGF